MGCCTREMNIKNKNNPSKPMNDETKNASFNPIQAPIITIGNDSQNPTQNIDNNNSQYPTQNIDNKHTQIPIKQTNNIENNNMVNLIENKKENFEKILQEKPKNCYCYTDEEYLEIYELLNKNNYNFEKDSMIYYKANYEIEDSTIHLKEYITIKTKKEEGKVYNSSFEYSTISITSNNFLALFYVKLNKINFQNFEYTKNNCQLSFIFNYNLSENDDSIITFEIDIALTLKINLCFTFILFKFFYKCNYRINIKSISDLFDFYSFEDWICGQNTLLKISPKEIQFKGKNVQQISYFIFKLKDSYISLNKKDPAFYCYDDTEMVNLEKAINNIEISCGKMCIFSYKDFYTIQSNICYVKSYMTFLYINNPDGINISFKHFLPEITDLKFINLKFNNNEENSSCEKNGSIENDGMRLTFNIPANIHFGTLEIDYSFSIRLYRSSMHLILISTKNLSFGGYFQLYISIKDDIYYSYYLNRKLDGYERKEKEISWKVFYNVKPKGYFNKLYLMLKSEFLKNNK